MDVTDYIIQTEEDELRYLRVAEILPASEPILASKTQRNVPCRILS